jgi:DNA-binding response OmpR family regulator
MMRPGVRRLLVVEDDFVIASELASGFTYLGYLVTVAYDGRDGLSKVLSQRFDAVLLDVLLPRLSGLEVLKAIRSDPNVASLPVLLLTGTHDEAGGLDQGADSYLVKPVTFEHVRAQIEALLRRAAPDSYPETDDRIVTLTFDDGHPTILETSGDVFLSVTANRPLALNVDYFARRARNALHSADWRFETKALGIELFNTLFAHSPDLLGEFKRQTGHLTDSLRIRLRCRRYYLGLPFEFCFDEAANPSDYLARRHPVARIVTGIANRRLPVTRRFLNGQLRRKEPVRVLLIASNTTPAIPGVDEEIDALKTSIPEWFAEFGVEVDVTTLPTSRATMDEVTRRLRGCTFHIVHYAGHGIYREEAPERSALLFWRKPDRQGGIDELTAARLQALLQESEVRFIYFSCCFGAAGASGDALHSVDFLGLVDGVSHAGVPSTIGFRRAISDGAAVTFASTFYRELATRGEVDKAALAARRETDRDDPAWLSNILVLQG